VIDDVAWRSRTVRIDAAQSPVHDPVPPNDLTSVVRELIRLCLLDTECSLLVVARTMGVSARTLQRELNAAGCTFRRLVVAERCARAAELLVETRSAIGDIALSSGYSSHNHLARAFKSLDLVPPGQYRSRMGKTKVSEPIKSRSANRPP
jgi:AraC-like DNA-binding protein